MKPQIVWFVNVVTNNGSGFIAESDACFNIAKNIIENTSDTFHYSVIMPRTKDLPKIDNAKIYHIEKPVNAKFMRFHFDWFQMDALRPIFDDASIFITDDNTHGMNWALMFESWGILEKIKVVTMTPFMAEPIYLHRQTESLKLSDLIVFQSTFNKVDVGGGGKATTIWPMGYSAKEIGSVDMNKKQRIVYFPNRITETTDQYHHNEFAEAISMVNHEDIGFVFLNPTGKCTIDQANKIAELSKGKATILSNPLDRVGYINFIKAASMAVTLCTQTYRGMSHDEAAAAGNVVITPYIHSATEVWPEDSPFVIDTDGRRNIRISPSDIASRIDKFFALEKNKQTMWGLYHQAKINYTSMENVSMIAKSDLLNLLNK